jgi:hypothetical protein
LSFLLFLIFFHSCTCISLLLVDASPVFSRSFSVRPASLTHSLSLAASASSSIV